MRRWIRKARIIPSSFSFSIGINIKSNVNHPRSWKFIFYFQEISNSIWHCLHRIRKLSRVRFRVEYFGVITCNWDHLDRRKEGRRKKMYRDRWKVVSPTMKRSISVSHFIFPHKLPKLERTLSIFSPTSVLLPGSDILKDCENIRLPPFQRLRGMRVAFQKNF